MKRFFIPTQSAEDWKSFLAEPDRQWKTGFSARSLAYSWESAEGFPPEVARLFVQSNIAAFHQIEILLAFPEYKVLLPGGATASQNDVFILAKDSLGHLVTITVEGKVSESFGPTLEEWNTLPSRGKTDRLKSIHDQLALTDIIPSDIRYQLLHRTVSAVIEGRRFNARSAVMIVHSFSRDQVWFEDYLKIIGNSWRCLVCKRQMTNLFFSTRLERFAFIAPGLRAT
jgi:hypothetical protein